MKQRDWERISYSLTVPALYNVQLSACFNLNVRNHDCKMLLKSLQIPHCAIQALPYHTACYIAHWTQNYTEVTGWFHVPTALPLDKIVGVSWTDDMVGPGVGLGAFPMTRIELRFLCRRISGWSLYRLRYRGSNAKRYRFKIKLPSFTT